MGMSQALRNAVDHFGGFTDEYDELDDYDDDTEWSRDHESPRAACESRRPLAVCTAGALLVRPRRAAELR